MVGASSAPRRPLLEGSAGIEVDDSFDGASVLYPRSALCRTAVAGTVIMDNGLEFARTAVDAWDCQRDVTLHFIRPEKPIRNTFIESFNREIQDCVSE